MVKYRNKFRVSHVLQKIKKEIHKATKGDVPTYVTENIMNRIDKGEYELILPMCNDGVNKSIAEYLNEYHCYKYRVWNLDFLQVAFMFVSERIRRKLNRFSDIDVEILEISDTDKRVVIKVKQRGDKQ